METDRSDRGAIDVVRVVACILMEVRVSLPPLPPLPLLDGNRRGCTSTTGHANVLSIRRRLPACLYASSCLEDEAFITGNVLRTIYIYIRLLYTVVRKYQWNPSFVTADNFCRTSLRPSRYYFCCFLSCHFFFSFHSRRSDTRAHLREKVKIEN